MTNIKKFRGRLLLIALLLTLGCAAMLFTLRAGISNGAGGGAGVGTNFSAGPFTAYLPNPTYPPAYVIASGAAGDVDLYTVPANRKALFLSQIVTNNTVGSITEFVDSKSGYLPSDSRFPNSRHCYLRNRLIGFGVPECWRRAKH